MSKTFLCLMLGICIVLFFNEITKKRFFRIGKFLLHSRRHKGPSMYNYVCTLNTISRLLSEKYGPDIPKAPDGQSLGYHDIISFRYQNSEFIGQIVCREEETPIVKEMKNVSEASKTEPMEVMFPIITKKEKLKICFRSLKEIEVIEIKDKMAYPIFNMEKIKK
jgi:hypothetical protein